MTKINNCPVCKSKKLFKFFKRKCVPVHENRIYKKRDSALKINKGTISLVCCENCGLIFNQTFEFEKLDYSLNYKNSQIHSPFFNTHVSNIANALKKKIKNSNILEIGCGDGYFLKKLINKKNNNFGIGYDPSYNGPLIIGNQLRFIPKFFPTKQITIFPDIIISRHVIEHVSNIISFLTEIRNASKKSKIFLEMPNVEWSLLNKQIWDFTYEHCSLFTNSSITNALNLTGFKCVKIKKVFNQQYLFVEAIPDCNFNSKKFFSFNAKKIIKITKNFHQDKKILINNIKLQLDYLSNSKIAIWGAAGKGVNFVNMFDPNRKIIDCLIDMNSEKWNQYVSGTGHKVVNYNQIEKRKIKSILILNPNYYNEIDKLLTSKNIKVNLIKLFV